MWDIIEQLVAAGTTILLTTQDMDEADRLAGKIVVIDGGKIIAEGTSDELKLRVGSEHLEITIAQASSFEAATNVFDGDAIHLDSKRRTLGLATKGGVHQLKQVLSRLDEAGVEVENVSFHRPTLDDVFLTLTGHTTGPPDGEAEKQEGGQGQ
jgi:ABC-2 type transport system ATP-binding protein